MSRGAHLHVCTVPGCRVPGVDRTGIVYRWRNAADRELVMDALPPSQDPQGWRREWRLWGKVYSGWQPVGADGPPTDAIAAAVAALDHSGSAPDPELADAVEMAVTEVETHDP